MRNSQHIIIFARAPIYGRVKRRLGNDIGKLRACQFYRSNLRKLIADLQSGPWNLHIALASSEDAKHPMFAGMSVMTQPVGDLGYRMRSAIQQFDKRQAIVIGSDVYGISRTHIKSAFSTLINHDVVFGPAFDGGFWLVGCGRSMTPGWRFMRGVRWSSQFALDDTLATVSSGCKVSQVSFLHDVDDGKTYHQLYGDSKQKKIT